MISEVNSFYGGSGGYPTLGGASSLQDDGRIFIWEATQMIQEGLHSHSMDVSRLLELTNNLSHVLEKTRQQYNNAISECEATYNRAKEFHKRLQYVENLVRHYSSTQDPVVASDGYTYEREALSRYLKDCSSSNSKAYSLQTKEELTDVVMPNISLMRLLLHLKAVPVAASPSLVRRTPITYFLNAQPTRPGWVAEEDALRGPMDSATGQPQAPSRVDPNPAHIPAVAVAVPIAVTATATATATAGSHRLSSAHRFEADTAKASCGGDKPDLHPCLRVYGLCNFMSDCTFANYPYEACLNHIKGKCRFSQNCKELHVDPRDPRYQNPRSFAAHHGHGNNNSSANANENNVNNNNNTTSAGEDVGTFSDIPGERMVSSNGSKSASNSVVQGSPDGQSQGNHSYNKPEGEVKKNGSISRMDAERATEDSKIAAGGGPTTLEKDEMLREDSTIASRARGEAV